MLLDLVTESLIPVGLALIVLAVVILAGWPWGVLAAGVALVAYGLLLGIAGDGSVLTAGDER